MSKNVIVISCDELRGDVPSFMGNKDCKTPFLDKLAARSVVFDNHFTVHGKCLPSRVAMMTGRYSHTDGFRTVMEENLLPTGDPNLMDCLKEHGYETAYFGHNHVFANLYTGNNERGASTPEHHSFTPEFEKILESKHEVPSCANSSGVANTPATMAVKCITEPLSGFCDDNRALQAIHFLKEVRDSERPFYMHLNFSAPHPGYKVEEPYFSMYDPNAIEFFGDAMPKNAPLPMRAMYEYRNNGATEEVCRKLQAVYYGMVTKVDTLIGQVLSAIESEDLWKDTVVLFWVDHGDFAGQYGLPEKWDTAMQDCIMHVAQTICDPELTPQRIYSLSEHTDIAPTILELLGFSDDWGIHGESLLPIIRGERVKEAVFADGGHEEPMRKRFNCTLYDKANNPATHGKQHTYFYEPNSMSRTKMVRTYEWKLVIRESGGNELYNLKTDPKELNNLYGDKAYNEIVLDLQLKMLNWCLKSDTDRPYQPKVHA